MSIHFVDRAKIFWQGYEVYGPHAKILLHGRGKGPLAFAQSEGEWRAQAIFYENIVCKGLEW